MTLLNADPQAVIEILKHHPIDLEPFEEIYKQIHANPELSGQEVETAALVVKHLRTLSGVEVTEGIGGYGVVGVLRNGDGPTVMLRADMDALPHKEQTGLSYASTKVATDAQGNPTPVMHACGHDMHTANLLAVASMLHAMRAAWYGTAVLVFQPAEELAQGARAMIADGLYDPARHAIPRPDIVLGSHVHGIRTGRLTLKAGALLTAVDSFRVRIHGRSGHICRADLAVDAVLTAAHCIARLQAIVTREARPEDFAVVACASVHGGAAPNLLPDIVDFTVSIRSYKPALHARLVAAVQRMVRAECEAAGCPREPEFETIMHAPATINDAAAVEKLRVVYGSYFGDRVVGEDPFGASEDFSLLASEVDAPYVFVMYGGHDGDDYDQAEREGTLEQRVHNNHSAFFAPVIQPTMSTAIDSFVLAALTFLGTP
jgi:amidohydrolase